MTTIDISLLSTVTGGACRQQQQQQQQPQQQGQPQGDDGQGGGGQPGAAPGGGDFMSGIDQFLGFLQSPEFGNFIGGIRGLFEKFAMPQQQQQQQ